MEATSPVGKDCFDMEVVVSKKDTKKNEKNETGAEASYEKGEVREVCKPVDEADGLKSLKDDPKGAFDEFVRII